MAAFDLYIQNVREQLEGLRRRGLPIREFDCPPSPEEIKDGLCVQVGPQANAGIILRSETFAELGNPLAGSCALVLWSDNPSLIHDGRITLVGSDIPESAGASLPFAQILMIGGKKLSDQDHESLLQSQYVADQIEGYMIKSAPDRIWSRVSKAAAEKGFNFEALGKAIIAIYRSEVPKLDAMEILFVTSGKEEVRQLDGITAQVRKISREIVTESWKIRGYDIECEADCSSCGDKPVCDDIRDVLAAKKKKDKQDKRATIPG